jgi:hypothetical protein
MTTLLIIVGILFGALLIGFLYHTIQLNSRKSEFKDWIVGDKLILKASSVEYTEIQKLNQSLGNVVGWNVDNIYLKIGDTTHKCEWSCFDSNKSALWRRNYDECKKYMGVDPGFNAELGESNSKAKIRGKTIELLSEVECEVYLMIAIDEEDYDTAELIKRRMEKFR